MNKNYSADWRSLRNHQTPEWFRDAKFGIYTHWGPYSVPAVGPNVSWYPHNMYREGTEQYKAHVSNYGDPSKFGYKDFIPLFTGENFDPDQWADMFHNAGARFAGPVAEHHDGFPMWDTAHGDWNAAKMGPKRDVVGQLEKSIRAKGMKYMVAMHHAENWWFFPHWLKNLDTADPRYKELYGELHNLDMSIPVEEWTREKEWAKQDLPDKAFLDRWMNRLTEVVDNYRPDYIWFDFGLKFIHEQYKKDFLAFYYNKEQEWGKEVVVSYKWDNLPPGTALVDIELGKMAGQTYYDWITDTTVDDGQGWGYMKDAAYKPATELVQYLVDNVSKNGYMLLNVGPKPDGTIPEEAQHTLAGIGKWLDVNGEAIYGTVPWHQYGEGPTKMNVDGAFSDTKEKVRYTGEDFRFTVKDNVIYAIALDWPEKDFYIKTLSSNGVGIGPDSIDRNSLYPGQIQSVELIGVDKPLQWRVTNKGLNIERPETRPCDHAYVFKITTNRTL